MRGLVFGAIASALVACAPHAAAPRAAPMPALNAARADEQARETRVTHGALAFVVRASPLANLVYQLDCLADRIPCSRGAFAEQWERQPEDEAMLASWRAVRAPYATGFSLDTGPLPKTAMPLPFVELNYDQQLRIAGLEAQSLEDYEHLLSVLTRPGDAHTLAIIARHFWPRFRAWWTARGRAILDEPYRDFSEMLARRADLGELVEKVARFYGGDVPAGAEIPLDLIARPKSRATLSTNGEHVVEHLVVEVLEGEKAEQRMAIIAHELFHHFSSVRSVAKKAALIERFAASTDPLASVGYNLLEESLATTFGNGLVDGLLEPDALARSLARENGLYDNRGIDRTAKALLPRAEEMLTRSIDDPQFMTTYLAAVHAAIGDAPPPREYLHSFEAAVAPAYKDSVHQLQMRALASHADAYAFPSEALPQRGVHRDATWVLFLARSDLPLLSEWGELHAFRGLEAEAKRAGPFIYAVPRGSHAYTFVFVADDASAMDRLTSAIVARDEALSGVLRPNP